MSTLWPNMTKLDHLYVWTATLLVAHQIDSAYWHEWNLFGIPGGVQLFVLLNVPLVLVFLFGLVQVVRAPRLEVRSPWHLPWLASRPSSSI